MRAATDVPKKRNRKLPPHMSFILHASTMLSYACGGRIVSACRNKKTSPLARAAPRLSCTPLLRGPCSTMQPACFAMATVVSVLPASTTIISHGVCSAWSEASVWGSTVASCSVGIITESLTLAFELGIDLDEHI